MSTNNNGSLASDRHAQKRAGNNNNRTGLIGLVALFGLAIPALGIRYLFPDLNPLFLVGLGGAVYSIYLGMLVHYSIQAEDREPAVNPVVINSRSAD